MNYLLISNTLSRNGGLFDHCIDEIKKVVGKNEVLYIPFALTDWDRFEKLIQKRFEKEKIKLISIHHAKDYKKAIEKARVLLIGGGNTFRLLRLLKEHDLLEIINKRVKSGKLIYIGSSAGTNVACPTIMTTNDMPIVQIEDFNALSLIPFQVNPHYIDPDPNKKDKMETRDQRIEQFLEENNTSVLGLREESYIVYNNKELILKGTTGAKLFTKNKKPIDLKQGEILNYLL